MVYLSLTKQWIAEAIFCDIFPENIQTYSTEGQWGVLKAKVWSLSGLSGRGGGGGGFKPKKPYIGEYEYFLEHHISYQILKTSNSLVFVGLQAMVPELIYHGPQIWKVNTCQRQVTARELLKYCNSLVAQKAIIIPPMLVGYMIVIVNSVVCASLAIYHLITNQKIARYFVQPWCSQRALKEVQEHWIWIIEQCIPKQLLCLT